MPRKTWTTSRSGTMRRCFNEAAARCRGKLRLPGSAETERICFNEAAARCRGKLGRETKHAKREAPLQ